MLSIKLSENGGKAPEAVPYMPAGYSEISCTVNGEADIRTVFADASACERLNADLQKKLAAAENREHARPVILFDHKAGAAAAVPLGFEWDEKRGVLLRVEWTQAGREAVEGGNYGYISPTFILAEGDSFIRGLQDGVEVGSLVNDPAFERNECIAASRVLNCNLPPFSKIENGEKMSDNINAANVGSKTTNTNTMNDQLEELKKALGLAESATVADVFRAVDELKMKLDEAQKRAAEVEAENAENKKELEEHKEAAADSFVDRLKQDGKVNPKDEETLKAARAMYMQNPKNTERIYASMQRIVPAEGKEQVLAGKVLADGKAVTLADVYATYKF